jgi:hypothetical protein
MSHGRWPRSRKGRLIRVARVCKRVARERRGREHAGGNEYPTRLSASERLGSTPSQVIAFCGLLTRRRTGVVAVWPKIRMASKPPIGQRRACGFMAVEDPGRRAVNAQSIPRRWCADLMLTTRASDTEPRRSNATIAVPMVLDLCLFRALELILRRPKRRTLLCRNIVRRRERSKSSD